MGFAKKFKKSISRPDKQFTGAAGPMSESSAKRQFEDIDTLYGLAPSGIGVLEDYFGISGMEAAEAAAKAKQDVAREGMSERERQFNITYGQQKPFYEAGAAMLPLLEQGATAQGYDDAISQLLSGSDVNAIRGSAIGDEAARLGINVPNDLGNLDVAEAMSIENMLNQRKQSLAGRGLTGGQTIAGYGQNKANAISNLLGDIGAAGTMGAMQSAQARAQGVNNLTNLTAGLTDYFRGS